MMAQKIEFAKVEMAFFGITVQAGFLKGLHYKVDMFRMLDDIVRPDDNVV
jgi:hypothetical protein